MKLILPPDPKPKYGSDNEAYNKGYDGHQSLRLVLPAAQPKPNIPTMPNTMIAIWSTVISIALPI
jgi:hypothetical protein